MTKEKLANRQLNQILGARYGKAKALADGKYKEGQLLPAHVERQEPCCLRTENGDVWQIDSDTIEFIDQMENEQ